MELFRLVLTYLLALLMLAAGVTHFIKTKMYLRIVPEVLPFRILIVQISGLVEILLGILLLFPTLRYYGALGVLVLMIVFLPLHIWDIFRERPAMGSKKAALIRLPLQFVLIIWSWFVMVG